MPIVEKGSAISRKISVTSFSCSTPKLHKIRRSSCFVLSITWFNNVLVESIMKLSSFKGLESLKSKINWFLFSFINLCSKPGSSYILSRSEKIREVKFTIWTLKLDEDFCYFNISNFLRDIFNGFKDFVPYFYFLVIL